MVANLSALFSNASTWIFEIASSTNSDEWEPLGTAASMSSGVQSLPTMTGHPICAYYSNKFAARCRLDLHLGNTRPRKFPSMTLYGTVNPSSNCRWSSYNAVADLFSDKCRRTLSCFGVFCTDSANVLDSRFFIWFAPDQ